MKSLWSVWSNCFYSLALNIYVHIYLYMYIFSHSLDFADACFRNLNFTLFNPFHFIVEVTMRLAEFVWLVYAKIILFKGIE